MREMTDEGSDQLLPATSYISTKLSDPVLLRYNYQNENLYSLEPKSIYTMFKQRVQKSPNHTALGMYITILV